MMDREALREYAGGALWVLPGISGLVALAVGAGMSQIQVSADSLLAFQGTADDARSLLVTVSGTVVTTIALVLGLTVVALQLSSTQFSPRLLRNFLRDRPNQVVLSIFVASFTYSAAGLYTVGVSSGARVEEFPRLAVSGAVLLLFVSLAAVVFFADHLAHSIQIDAITKRAEQGTLAVVRATKSDVEVSAPHPPQWAVSVPTLRSGSVQAVHTERVLPLAGRFGVTMRLQPHVGAHVVAGTTLAWAWQRTASGSVSGSTVRSTIARIGPSTPRTPQARGGSTCVTWEVDGRAAPPMRRVAGHRRRAGRGGPYARRPRPSAIPRIWPGWWHRRKTSAAGRSTSVVLTIAVISAPAQRGAPRTGPGTTASPHRRRRLR